MILSGQAKQQAERGCCRPGHGAFAAEGASKSRDDFSSSITSLTHALSLPGNCETMPSHENPSVRHVQAKDVLRRRLPELP